LIIEKGLDNLEIIDVREPEEYSNNHIKGAKLIPLGTIDVRLNDIDWNKQVIFVCRSGARSNMAMNVAAIAGHEAANLAGGMMDVESTSQMREFLEK
jgi:rhodanese-related sulfurtransferase